MTTGSHEPDREARSAPAVSCSVNAAPGLNLACDAEVPVASSAHEPREFHAEPRCVKKVRLLNRFIDEALAGLPPTAAVLWLTLFRFARGGIAVVGQKTLAARLGVDVKTVKRNLRVLYRAKLVRVRKRAVEGKKVNEYQLGILALPARPKPDRPSGKTSPGKPK